MVRPAIDWLLASPTQGSTSSWTLHAVASVNAPLTTASCCSCPPIRNDGGARRRAAAIASASLATSVVESRPDWAGRCRRGLSPALLPAPPQITLFGRPPAEGLTECGTGQMEFSPGTCSRRMGCGSTLRARSLHATHPVPSKSGFGAPGSIRPAWILFLRGGFGFRYSLMDIGSTAQITILGASSTRACAEIRPGGRISRRIRRGP